MKNKEETMEQPDCGVLSIPNVMLEAAGIPPDSDLTVETIPGVLLIGTEEPLKRANQPLLDLLEELGIPQEEVTSALEEGGYLNE
nr:hypothetical protein [uncultured Eisenbergiella sp.]